MKKELLKLKKLEQYRKNNEYYIKLLNKIEDIKEEYLLNNIKTFDEIIIFLNNNPKYYLINKKDKRKIKKEFLNNFYKEYLENNTLKNKQNKIKEFFELFYLTFNLINNTKDENFKKIISYQKNILNKIIYLNYPYVFKKITDYIKYNNSYKIYIEDIENT